MNQEKQLNEGTRRQPTKRERRLAERDLIFREPLHEEPPRERAMPVKGSFDVPFLLITSALVLFGCVMVYSASSVYAEQYHDDNTYFIARHLLFLVMAIAFTAIIVRFCTPHFWHDFGYVLFGVSVVLLLLVLVVGSS